MATKPGSGNNKPTSIPTRDRGLGQDQRPTYIPGRVQEQINHRDTTISRVQPRRDGGGGSGSGGGSNGR